MPNQIYSATLEVKVNGTALPDAVATRLTYALVETARRLPGMFELHFADGERTVLARSGLTVGAAVKLSVRSNEPGATELFDGEVVTLEAEIGPLGALTIVRGYDRSYRLLRQRRVAAYQDQTVADIARRIAGDHGLTASVSSQVKHQHVLQAGTSDWAFLHELADAEGLAFSVSGTRLTLADPATAAPGSPRASARTDATVLQYGANLRSLRAAVTASDQVKEVEVRGWDPTNHKPTVATATARTSGVKIDQTPAKLATAIASSPRLVHAPQASTQAQASALADAVADEVGGAFAELEGVVTGNPALAAGGKVTLAGLGAPFDGGYVLTRVTHRFEPGETGYTTAFQVSSGADRTTRGVLSGGGEAGAALAPRVGGAGGSGGGPRLVLGVVTNNQDPDSLGRVRLKLPTLSDSAETWWSHVVMPGAGTERGFSMVPDVNDLVVVALPESAAEAPWVLGGLHHPKVKTPATKEQIKAATAMWVSKSGMTVQLVEKQGSESIRLSIRYAEGSDEDSIVIAKDTSKGISISSKGPVAITADGDVTVKAKGKADVTADQDVSVKGMNVSITGNQKISLKAPQIELAGDAKIAAKAAALELKADGMAELSASGILTVKGSLVKIN